MHEQWDLSDPDERELAAGEYVLGTLDRNQVAAFEALLAVSPALQQHVAAWREHLQILNDQLPPVPPPASLWPRIAQRLGVGRRPWLQRLGVWRSLTAGLAIASLSLALLWYQAPGQPMIPGDAVFVVLDENQVPGWIISASVSGELMVQAVQPGDMPAGMGGELWMMDDGQPVSLGMLPSHGEARMIMPQRLRAALTHADLAVSIEPASGAPHGQPTGPVIDHGKLIPMRNSSVQL
ncbi:anti-sigma factor [Halomonas sp. HP20-15]|uniref:anti-sigma factor n=1 Tax=Halomonas sp. HP20-15 TaxID=3085901 RepID=UPI0029820BEF|nr:anti-sigma factor [Halomonas sp. HP20-15]MDW5375443.1 anti-sigma factor [Halomonas sp. HP20-15]